MVVIVRSAEFRGCVNSSISHIVAVIGMYGTPISIQLFDTFHAALIYRPGSGQIIVFFSEYLAMLHLQYE